MAGTLPKHLRTLACGFARSPEREKLLGEKQPEREIFRRRRKSCPQAGNNWRQWFVGQSSPKTRRRLQLGASASARIVSEPLAVRAVSFAPVPAPPRGAPTPPRRSGFDR